MNEMSGLYRNNPSFANKLIRSLLPTYDLSNFANSIDRCVSTAREISAYKGWLRRPADNWAFYVKTFDINKYTNQSNISSTSVNKRV